VGRFFEAYDTKKKMNALPDVQRILLSLWIINIPGELPLSRAHFRLLMNATKLILKLYIYKPSKFWGGYICASVNLVFFIF
jgi:hypothetical protein